MNQIIGVRTVAVLSFAFTYLFFLDYLPPSNRVHIPYDLEGFHSPLADYAFQAIRHGRFPEWDPTIYCGLSFVGNIQAALFYPPTWLLFLSNFGQDTLSYQSLQCFAFLHVWLAFMLCYVWLKHRGSTSLARLLGAGVFAYSGYMLNQLQHLGLITGWAWMPLALWGIDQASEQQHWRPLWKVAVASALCFLAGYPPTWFVFAVCAVSYAAWRWKVALGVILALAASLLLAAVQLLPSIEASGLKTFDPRYGPGWRNPEAYVAYFVPNYFNFGLHHVPSQHWGGDYLYLGAPAFLGLLALARRPRWRELLPSLTVLAVCLVMATNPFHLVSGIIRHSNLLYQICRDWYFLAGLTLAAASLAALGLDHLLRQSRRPVPGWLALLVMSLLLAWSVRQMLLWLPLGSDFPTGWKSAIAPAITLALFSAAIFILPAERGVLRAGLVTVLLLAVGVDYKVFGTGKWFDASEGDGFTNYKSFPGFDDSIYRQLRENSQYRIALDLTAPFPLQLRHYGLTTPQGFDPLLTTNYQKLMFSLEHPRSNLEFDIDPANKDALVLLGVRYFVTDEGAPLYRRLASDPGFRLLPPASSYYRTFEFTKARPPYGWISLVDGKAQCVGWKPEAREFVLDSETGGRFTLAEQFYPGWRATIDGSPAVIQLWSEAFQAVTVPPGEHRVEFRFRSLPMRIGACVSLLAVALLVVGLWLSTRRVSG
ncbi:MAG: hypothetical protein ABSE86_01680 [Bryobacteraceae bacterium]|jgi:hypothetical protein